MIETNGSTLMSDANSAPKAADQSARPKQARAWLRIVRSGILTYLLLLALMTMLQRSLIYHPRTAGELNAGLHQEVPGGVFDFEFQGADGTSLNGWLYRRNLPRAESPESALEALDDSPCVVLYFPGNAGNRSTRIYPCQMLAELGCDVLIADYRGFGDNPGSPSEDVLIADAHSLWNHVRETCGVPHNRIVLFGESLGGGPAVRLAADLSRAGTPPAGDSLELRFVGRRGPVALPVPAGEMGLVGSVRLRVAHRRHQLPVSARARG